MSKAVMLAMFAAIGVAVCLPLVLAWIPSAAVQAKLRARRMAEHRMNARLLRFNL